MLAKFVAAGLIAGLVATPVFAEEIKSLGISGDWKSFTYADKAGKVCYAATSPKRVGPPVKGRPEAFLTVTHRPAAKSFDVVSITAVAPYKKDAVPDVDIGGTKFEFYTQADTAWARNDKVVVQAMQKGKAVVVHGTPVKGDATADTFSLAGFTQAYAAIGRACGVK
jgi:hypothetical protein